MVAKVNSVAFEGIEARKVEVQVQFGPGVPSVNIVGLADKEIAESKERIKAAFYSLSLSFPLKRVVVNLAPADLHKDGTHYDLPIALAILAKMELIDKSELAEYFVVGELSLDGLLNGVSGVLPAAIRANAEDKGIICPEVSGEEAACSGNPRIIAAPDLLTLMNHLNTKQIMGRPALPSVVDDGSAYPDLVDVKGQLVARRALEIAAAGGHSLLMIGPPGAGKSMLAKRLIGILPPLTIEEKLEASIIGSIAGRSMSSPIVTKRPFRAPHSSASVASLIGGGKYGYVKPGEVTLAHNGVLFLDELPQFPSNALEALRQPIEDKIVTVCRVNSHVTYPCKFHLIAAMNPCKCGHFGDANLSCNRAPKCASDYQSKISGPLFDRFDIRVDVLPVGVYDIAMDMPSEPSSAVAQRVLKARKIQDERYADAPFKLNAYVDGEKLDQYIRLTSDAQDVLHKAATKFSVSMRGYTRILRVARTIADMDGAQDVEKPHIAEAFNFRVTRFRI